MKSFSFYPVRSVGCYCRHTYDCSIVEVWVAIISNSIVYKRIIDTIYFSFIGALSIILLSIAKKQVLSSKVLQIVFNF